MSFKGSKAVDLYQKLEEKSGMKGVVIIDGYPDPDAISSAFALKHIGDVAGTELDILTFQEASHQENRALLKLLDIPIIRCAPGDADVEKYQYYCIVDSQKPYTRVDSELERCGVSFEVFIDHHKKLPDIKAGFVDVCENIGAVASMMVVYLQSLRKAQPEKFGEGSISTQLATLLAYGIRSDTRNFIEATPDDYAAMAFLSPMVDSGFLKSVSRQSLTPEVMELIFRAIGNKQVLDNYLISSVGAVRPEDRDGIPQAAEFLLRRAGTDTVIVFGVVGGESVDGSLRTSSEVVDPDSFLKKTFGSDKVTGKHFGGGNTKDKGGFQIPLGFLSACSDPALVEKIASEIVIQKFKTSIGKPHTIPSNHTSL